MVTSDSAWPKILIVDDTMENLEIVGGLLEKNKYDIYLADSGQAALDLLAHIQPDLILLDVMMPDLDGYETCLRIRAIEAYDDIPIIFLSARIDIESLIKGFESGAVDYIRKPFNTLELLARIKTHVELKRIRRELELAAAHDPLTGLLNQREMLNKIDYEQARFVRKGEMFAILAVRIVNYPEIVAGCGRSGGNQLLKRVAQLLQENVRELDFVCRWDSDQFLLLLPETGSGGALTLMQRLASLTSARLEPCPMSGLVPVLIFGSQVYSQEMNQQHFIKLAFRNLADRLSNPASSAGMEQGQPDISRLRVLIAEDDEMNRLLLTRICERYDVSCQAVGDGQAAVAAYAATPANAPFDAVLLDWQMPVLNGTQAARQIRALSRQPHHPPVWLAALSGNRLEDLQDPDAAALFDYQLQKPFTPEDIRHLFMRIAEQLQRLAADYADSNQMTAQEPDQASCCLPAEPSGEPAQTGKRTDPASPDTPAAQPRTASPDVPQPGGVPRPGNQAILRMTEDTGNFASIPLEPDPDVQFSLATKEAVLAKVNGDLHLLRLLLAKFVQSATTQLAALRQAAQAEDWPGLARSAHDLKGGLAIFNAFATMDLAHQLERIGRQGPDGALDASNEKIVHLIAIIERDVAAIVTAYTAYLDECSAAPLTEERHD